MRLTPEQESRRTLYMIAWIFMIITTIFFGFLILPLIWMIPMTIATKRTMDEVGTYNEREHVGLGVCELIFGNLVSGILVLISGSMYNSNKNNVIQDGNVH